MDPMLRQLGAGDRSGAHQGLLERLQPDPAAQAAVGAGLDPYLGDHPQRPQRDPGGLEDLGVSGGVGVDHVVEVGGAGTLQKSVASLAFGGHIGLIGVLTQGELNPLPLMGKSGRLSGIYVGSREMFIDMNAAISANRLKPVIDRTFDFGDARGAYNSMLQDSHFGKIVIRVCE